MSVGLALWAGHGSRSRSDKINLVTLPPPLRGDILSLAVESSSYKRVTMQLLCVVVDAVVEPIASKDTMIYVARLAPRFCQLGRLWLHGGSLFENLRSSLKRPENRICHDISYLWSREKGKSKCSIKEESISRQTRGVTVLRLASASRNRWTE